MDGIWQEPDSYLIDSGKNTAMYPAVASDLLFDEPIGFVFGKWKGQYVCKAPDMEGAVLVLGGSGTGKSQSQILPFILASKESIHKLMLDLKHELTDYTFVESDNTLIFDVMNRTIGYDAFFMLNEDSSSQDIYDCMSLIAVSIIPKSGSVDQSFWIDAAREMFLGLLIYTYQYKKIRTLSECVDYILSFPIKQIMQECIEEVPNSSLAYKQLQNFVDLPDETCLSILENLTVRVKPLANDQYLYFTLSTARKKWSPATLLESSVNICIPIEKLNQWGGLIYLIYNQTINYILSLPDKRNAPTRPHLSLCLDETVALLAGVGGQLEMLPQALRFIRSKDCSIIVCCQSLAGLRTVLPKEVVDDMRSNFAFTVILNSVIEDDCKALSELIGTYKAKNVSWNGYGSKRTPNISFTDDYIVNTSDLMRLPKEEKVILISSNGYGYMCIDKCMAYKDEFFSNKLNKI